MVLLTKVGEPEANLSGRTRRALPISGAEVWLIIGTDRILLQEGISDLSRCVVSPYEGGASSVAGPGCYEAILPGRIESGRRYDLEIRLPSGESIEGSAIVPHPPLVVEPIAHTRFNVRMGHQIGLRDDIPILFDADAEVGIGAALEVAAIFADGSVVPNSACSFLGRSLPSEPATSASTSLPISPFSCVVGTGAERSQIVPDSIHAQLLVTAYDLAFSRYMKGIIDTATNDGIVNPEQVAQGISGGYGLFAGEATTRRPITLIPLP